MSKTTDTIAIWLSQLPGDNPGGNPNVRFSFQAWLEEGKAIRNVVNNLVKMASGEANTKGEFAPWQAIYALGWMEEATKAIPEIGKHLHSEVQVNRAEAIAALGRLGAVDYVEQFQALAEDPREDINVRGNAIIALGNLKQSGAKGTLLSCAVDSDPFISGCAREAMDILDR